jgi:hypothetical protein
MVVDVLYDGLPLQTGANARTEGNGAFIELEAPMPVGTRLTVRGPDGEKPARVEKVHEGVGAGVLVRFLEANASEAAAADSGPEAAEGEAADGEAEAEPDKKGQAPPKKRKGRKGR